MAKRMDKSHCRGCYNNDYNHGLGGATECWSLATAKVVLRRRVHRAETPPWTAKPERLPSCFQQKGYIFVDPKVTR